MTRKDIILAAARIIRDEGYDQLTLSALAGSLGVTKASLFHHFRGKDEIIDAVYSHFEEECIHLGFTLDFSKSPGEIFSTALSHWRDLFDHPERSCFTSLLEQRKEVDSRAMEDSSRFRLMVDSQSEAIIDMLSSSGKLDCPDVKLTSRMFGSTIWRSLLTGDIDAEDFVSSFLEAYGR